MFEKIGRISGVLALAMLAALSIVSCAIATLPFEGDAGSAFSRAAGPNLLSNPGFETAGASGWTETLSASIYAFDASAAGEYKSGSKARGYWLNSGSTGTVELKQSVSVSAGTYTAKVWTRLDGSSANYKRLKVVQGGSTVASANLPVGSTYAQTVISGISLSAGTATFVVDYEVPNGNVYLTVDDAELFNEGTSTTTTAGGTTTTVSSGNIIYVKTSGNDTTGNGTDGNAYRTIVKAASVATSGKTINVGSGTFSETAAIQLPLGVSLVGAGQGSTIITSSGAVPVINAGVSSSDANWKLVYDGSLIVLASQHRTTFRNNTSSAVAPANGNQTLSGFTVDGNNKTIKAGVWVENRNNVTMHHVTFTKLDMRGAVFGPGDKDWYVEPAYYMTGINIYDCIFTDSGKDISGETIGNLNLAQLDGANVYNITINDTAGYGIKFIYDGYFKNTKVYNVTISLNESDPLWGEDIAIELWNLGPGNEVYNVTCNTWLSMVNHPGIFANPASAGTNLKLYNIRMVDNDASSSKEAVEIALPGVEIYNSLFQNKGFGVAAWDAGGYKVSIHNNIFYNSVEQSSWAKGGVYLDNSTGRTYSNINIYNNVFDKYSDAVTLKNSGGGINTVNIKNNVFLNVSAKHLNAVGSSIVFQYNQTSNTLNQTGATTNSNNYVSSATGFNASGDRLTNWYKPSSSGAYVIDKGANVGIAYNGSAPDLGAFEFATGGTTTTTVASTTSTSSSTSTSTTVAGTTSTSSSTSTSTSTTVAGGFTAGTYKMSAVSASPLIIQTDSYAGCSNYNQTYSGSGNQKWIITAVGAYYKIVGLQYGYCLEGNSNDVKSASYTGVDQQLWSIVSLGGGQYKVLNKLSGNAVRVQDLYSGNPLKEEAYNGSDNDFKWTFAAP